MNQKEYEEQLRMAGEFHGEICGGIAIGTKLAMYGLELMGMELNTRHKNLVVILEIDRCMSDAVQSVTGCSMGKRTLKQMYYGKFAVTFYNIDREEIQKDVTEIKWDAEAAEKGGYEHFMLKEIHEQPKVVRDTINSVVKDGKIDFSGIGLTDDEMQKIDQIYIVACGTAYHAGLVGKYHSDIHRSLRFCIPRWYGSSVRY